MKRSILLVAALLAWTTAAMAQDHVPPNAVTGLTVSAGKTTAVINWNAPSDQCNSNAVAEYELRYSTSTFTECNFSSGTLITTGTPSSPGVQECYDTTGHTLSQNTTYYFAVRSKDSSGNWSTLSNVGSATTHGLSEVICVRYDLHGQTEPFPAAGGACVALMA
jgi:hypothetical protein